MARNKKHPFKTFITGLICFVAIFAVVFFGIQFVTKTGIFKIPGVVYYGEGLNETELGILKNIFNEELVLDKDVSIDARTTEERPDLQPGEYLYLIEVPTNSFYENRNDVSEYEESEIEWIPFEELDFTKKLLAVNGEYYLDDFNRGAKFRIITFDSEKFEEEIKPLVDSSFSKNYPSKEQILTFAQTGVTAMSRGMNAKLKAVGGDATYFAENIKDFLSGFDLTHTSNESSFTDYATSANICSDKRFIDTLTTIGLDIVELTGNHNQDCGNQAAIESIDTYLEKGIKIVGGGKTADEAKIPLNISKKDSKITFLAYNQSTGGATHGATPGANQYYEENAVDEITKAKENGDLVIVDIQYYECSGYASEYEDRTCDYANSSAGDQVGFFRHLIDLGADIVVGTSAHQPQTYELYGNGVIFYGLGNLFFDQIWWPGTTRSLVLSHYIYGNKLLQTKVVPTVYDASMQTRIMDEETRKWFIERLMSVRP